MAARVILVQLMVYCVRHEMKRPTLTAQVRLSPEATLRPLRLLAAKAVRKMPALPGKAVPKKSHL
jgi:hypothetical protein